MKSNSAIFSKLRYILTLLLLVLSPFRLWAISTDPLTDLANQLNTSFPVVITIVKILMWAVIIFCLLMAMFKFKAGRGDAAGYIMAVVGVLFVYVVFEVFF